LTLLPRQVPRLLSEIGQITFQCRPAEQLAAPLERFAQLLLRLG
jgi:hypothetical protein